MIPILRSILAGGSGASQVALAGTAVSPRTAFDSTIAPTQASVDWEFRSDGTVYKLETFSETPTQDNAGTTWWTGGGSPPTNSYWIQFTLLDTLQDTPDAGDALTTWHSLDTTRSFGYNRTTAGGEAGTIVVKIASDSAGTNVLATGYYDGEIDVSAK